VHIHLRRETTAIPLPLDESFADSYRARYGTPGSSWLAELPQQLTAAAAAFDCEPSSFLRSAGAGACFAVTQSAEEDGRVIKLSPPWAPWEAEAEALALWNGRGAPQLHGVDWASRALLLERVEPGETFQAQGRTALGPFSALLAQLHAAPTDGLVVVPPLATELNRRFTEALGGSLGREISQPAELSDDERQQPDIRFCLLGLHLAQALNADSSEPVLLHGDPVNENLLSSWRGDLVAVNPSPAHGDPAYDAAAWLTSRNLGSHSYAYVRFLAERLELDHHRLSGWTAALTAAAVLADPANAELHRLSRLTLFAAL
jgi:streptomycin 6-kinase